LESVFHEQLKSFVLSPDEFATHLAAADEAIREKQDLVDALTKEQRQVEQAMNKVHRAYLADEISVQSYGKQYRPLEERLNQIESEIPKLQAEIDFAKIQLTSSDEILSEARNLYTRWPELPFDHKRQVVETITEKIVIGHEDVAIDLCYLPSAASKELTQKQRNFTGSSPRSA
jgi:site-specific DNA recombinase